MQSRQSVGHVDRRTAIKAGGAGVAGIAVVGLPRAAHASSGDFIASSSSYASGSIATMQLRFDIKQATNGNRNVRLEFHRTSYIPSGTAMQVKVDWGDGTGVQTYTSSTIGAQVFAPGGDSDSSVKTYAADGIYTVTITEATAGIGVGSGTQNGWSTTGMNMLTDVLSWSNIGSLAGGFIRASALTSVPNYLPTGVVSLEGCFKRCTLFNSPINNWDTSRVTSMYQTFADASSFNQNIGSWNLGSCTNLRDMFNNATVFNNGGSDSIQNWNTGNVTSMLQTFARAGAFNQPINTWNTANVTTMYGMFLSAVAFNQPLNLWNTGQVTDMGAMFAHSSSTPPMAFDQDISMWTVAQVTSKNQFVNTTAAWYQSTWLRSERPAPSDSSWPTF